MPPGASNLISTRLQRENRSLEIKIPSMPALDNPLILLNPNAQNSAMKPVISAFSSPSPLCPHHPILLSNRCHRQERLRRTRSNCTPTMVTSTSVASELLAAAVLGYGTYYLIFRDKAAAKSEEQEHSSTSSREGIIGLSSSHGNVSGTRIVARTMHPNTPTPPLFDTVGVDINDYLDSGDGLLVDKQRRLEEELTFAANSLSDLSDCDATIIIDTVGDVVWVDGDLIGDTMELGRLPSRVSETGKPESLNVENNEILPFLKHEVRNVAVLPVGEQGAVLVIASRQKDFFGAVEQRVANAVCGRLASFLYDPPAL